MREKIRDIKFKPDSLAKIQQMVKIVEEYQRQGLRLTARQLYYQLVSRDLVPNQPAEYKKLTALLTDARYAGLVDWDAIEDRGRVPDQPSEWSSKGYSSASAMRESAERIMSATGWSRDEYDALVDQVASLKKQKTPAANVDEAVKRGLEKFRSSLKPTIIFYLGDHDPSGEDMVRDIRERLSEFHKHVDQLEVRKIALTMEQIKKYDPPPNPAKVTDPRADKYIAEHGDSSWEVDALPPDVLAQLVRKAFKSVIDQEAMSKILAREEADKRWLRDLVDRRTR